MWLARPTSPVWCLRVKCSPCSVTGRFRRVPRGGVFPDSDLLSKPCFPALICSLSFLQLTRPLQRRSLADRPALRGLAGSNPHFSPYLSVQLFNQGDVSKIGVNRKDASRAGVKADVVGDRVSLGVCSIQGVHMRAWRETQRGDLESGI